MEMLKPLAELAPLIIAIAAVLVSWRSYTATRQYMSVHFETVYKKFVLEWATSVYSFYGKLQNLYRPRFEVRQHSNDGHAEIGNVDIGSIRPISLQVIDDLLSDAIELKTEALFIFSDFVSESAEDRAAQDNTEIPELQKILNKLEQILLKIRNRKNTTESNFVNMTLDDQTEIDGFYLEFTMELRRVVARQTPVLSKRIIA